MVLRHLLDRMTFSLLRTRQLVKGQLSKVRTIHTIRSGATPPTSGTFLVPQEKFRIFKYSYYDARQAEVSVERVL
jgi:hypothetical protein